MNNPHQNARTTFHSRELIVARRAAGRPVAVIAAELGISGRTVYKWLRRWREGGRAALSNRASAPARPGAGHATHWRQVVVHLRREHRMTGAEIADRLALARSTVARWLHEAGIGRLKALEPREPPRRYQRETPGEMIHIDIKKLGRFTRVGHRITGDRKGQSATRGVGWDFVHVAIDDATRLAYVEVLPDERRGSATGFLVRALRWFRDRGVRVQRVMTDNGSCYRSRLFAKALRWLGIRHVRTRPYTPRTNGKAERFIQTLIREWAYAIPYPTSERRTADLPRWLDWYNQRRPHSALKAQPPNAALNNALGTHS
jgi:transposase InsO family protein